jgi:hypothetical protein
MPGAGYPDRHVPHTSDVFLSVGAPGPAKLSHPGEANRIARRRRAVSAGTLPPIDLVFDMLHRGAWWTGDGETGVERCGGQGRGGAGAEMKPWLVG